MVEYNDLVSILDQAGYVNIYEREERGRVVSAWISSGKMVYLSQRRGGEVVITETNELRVRESDKPLGEE